MAKYKPQIRQSETNLVDLDLCAKYDGEGNDIVETYAKKGESGGGGGVPVIDLGESTLTDKVVTGTLSDEDYSTIVNSDFSVLKLTKSTDNTIHYFAYSIKQGLGYTFVESFSSSYIVVMSTKMWTYTKDERGIYLNTYKFTGTGTGGFCSFYTRTKNGVTLPLEASTLGTYIGASGYYENSMKCYPIVAVENTRISTNIIFYYIDGTSLKRGFSSYSVTRVKMGS